MKALTYLEVFYGSRPPNDWFAVIKA